MRIEIEIPKEFEGDYDADRFSDFFSRAMIDIETMQGMCGRYEIETAEMLRKAFSESKIAYDVEALVVELGCASYQTESTFDEDGYCNDDSEEVVELHTAISIVRGKE